MPDTSIPPIGIVQSPQSKLVIVYIYPTKLAAAATLRLRESSTDVVALDDRIQMHIIEKSN